MYSRIWIIGSRVCHLTSILNYCLAPLSFKYSTCSFSYLSLAALAYSSLFFLSSSRRWFSTVVSFLMSALVWLKLSYNMPLKYNWQSKPHAVEFQSLPGIHRLLEFLAFLLLLLLAHLLVQPFALLVFEEFPPGVVLWMAHKLVLRSSPSNSLQPEMASLSTHSGCSLKKVSLVLFIF